MSKYLITIDSGSDLPIEVCKENNIIPMIQNYTLDYVSYKDTMKEEDYKVIYKKLKKGSLYISENNNAYSYIEFWYKILKENKTIIHICVGDKTYKQAMVAKEILEKEIDGVSINIIETSLNSLGSGMLALKISELKSSGLDVKEIVDFANEEKKLIKSLYSVKCSRKLRKISNTFECLSKYQNNVSLKDLTIGDTLSNPGEQTLYISHSNDIKKVKKLGKKLKESYGFKDVFYSCMSPDSNLSNGLDVVAMFFYKNANI